MSLEEELSIGEMLTEENIMEYGLRKRDESKGEFSIYAKDRLRVIIENSKEGYIIKMKYNIPKINE